MPSEVTVPILNHYGGISGTLLREVILAEGGIYQTSGLLQVCGSSELLPHRCILSGPEVLLPNPIRAYGSVPEEASHFPVHHHHLTYCVINWAGCQRHWDDLSLGSGGLLSSTARPSMWSSD